jgi:hypothetical protein
MAHCMFKGIVIHELMHALGVYHEHSRIDRDNYIKINMENIENEHESKFVIYNGETFLSPYDIYSIMHYDSYAFSKNGLPTIEAINPSIGMLDGSEEMTINDAQMIRNLYNFGVNTASFLKTSSNFCAFVIVGFSYGLWSFKLFWKISIE